MSSLVFRRPRLKTFLDSCTLRYAVTSSVSVKGILPPVAKCRVLEEVHLWHKTDKNILCRPFFLPCFAVGLVSFVAFLSSLLIMEETLPKLVTKGHRVLDAEVESLVEHHTEELKGAGLYCAIL